MRREGLAAQQPVHPQSGRFARRRRFLFLGVCLVLVENIAFWLIGTGSRPFGEAARTATQTPGGMIRPSTPEKAAGTIPQVQLMKPTGRDVVQPFRLHTTISPYYQ